MRTVYPIAVPLAFLSGACALLYEVTWLREFRALFGASTLASATVLGTFIAGIGWGGRVLGRRADREVDPFLFYLKLEGMIALAAALSPALLWCAKWLYLTCGGSSTLGSAGATVIRLVLAAPLLLPATFLMGGTLPALAQATEDQQSPGRHRTALLYGINTLGAVCGAFSTTFFLLETLGDRATIWLGAALNLLIVLVGLFFRKALSLGTPSTTSSEGQTAAQSQIAGDSQTATEGPLSPIENAITSVEAVRNPDTSQSKRGHTSEVESKRSDPSGYVPALAFASGFVFFLMELVYYRMLGPILGGSVYTLGLILTVALLGIGLGATIYSFFGAHVRPRLSLLSWTFALQGTGLALPYIAGDRVALWAARLQVDGGATLNFAERVAGWSQVTAFVVLPSALVAGFQFPLLVGLSGQGRRGIGTQTGNVYAYNTAGSVLGSFVGGFGLISLLGAEGTWTFSIVLLLGLSVWLALLAARPKFGRSVVPRLAIALTVLGALKIAEGPTAVWRHGGIGVGRFPDDMFKNENNERNFVHTQRRLQIWEEDGVESSVAMMGLQGMAFVVNGKIDGHLTNDAPTQVMSGLLGAMIHGAVESSLVIGLGTGSTAGWLAQAPGMKRVDVYELEPDILRVARDSFEVNQNALERDNLHVHMGDGRELLLTTQQKYDLIASEPSNPYRAGIASLFTAEFYAAVAQRLNPGGLFVQWVQVYEVDHESIDLVIRTLASVFPHIEIWRTHRDLLLLASQQQMVNDVETIRARMKTQPYREGLRIGWRVSSLEGLAAYFVARPEYAKRLAAASSSPLNHDDKNVLEFGFARSVDNHKLFSMEEVLQMTNEQGLDLPHWAKTLNLDLIEAARSDVYERRKRISDEQALALHHVFLKRFLKLGLMGRRLEPEWVRVALETASTEYLVVEAASAYRNRRFDKATEKLLQFLEKAKDDPWVFRDAQYAGLRLVQLVGLQARESALSFLPTLSERWQARALEDYRRQIVVRIANRHGLSEPCLRILSEMEPWVPWERSFLEARVGCYEKAKHHHLGRAQADLLAFNEASARAETSGRTAALPASDSLPRSLSRRLN